MDNKLLNKDSSLFEIFMSSLIFTKILLNNKKKLLFILLCGSVAGYTYSKLIPIKYSSTITFVVEEPKSMGSGLSAIAGQFGIDLSSNSGSGYFSGDNILLFLKSESLCRQALMTEYDNNGKKTLADIYAESLGLKSKWDKKFGKDKVSFVRFDFQKLPRREDSLLQILVKNYLIKSDLNVFRLDKKSSFINLIFVTKDEKLSYLFTKRLFEIATSKYLNSKLKVKLANVNSLQKKADSILYLLNSKTFSNASNQQMLIDVNPGVRVAGVNSEISAREKIILNTLYTEVIKNLEISKTLLTQESPALEIIDQSTFPLEKIYVNKLKSTIFGGIGFVFIYLVWLILLSIYKRKIG
jgi:hypothetical protein